MATLHIEHPISDLPTCCEPSPGARRPAGRQACELSGSSSRSTTTKYIYVDLDFDNVEQAAAFQQFLETNVWISREASPALAGTPRARVLTKVDTGPSLSSS